MSERYTRLFSLQKNLYTYSSPVTIAAGALLKDNSTNQMLVQLKFQNISNKVIKAIKVNLVLMDTLGNILSENTEHQYLDTDLHRNNYFGQKIRLFYLLIQQDHFPFV